MATPFTSPTKQPAAIAIKIAGTAPTAGSAAKAIRPAAAITPGIEGRSGCR